MQRYKKCCIRATLLCKKCCLCATLLGGAAFLPNTINITIVDMNGRIVHGSALRPAERNSGALDAERNDFTMRIDVSNLAQGTYYLRVTGEGINRVKKLVILKENTTHPSSVR